MSLIFLINWITLMILSTWTLNDFDIFDGFDNFDDFDYFDHFNDFDNFDDFGEFDIFDKLNDFGHFDGFNNFDDFYHSIDSGNSISSNWSLSKNEPMYCDPAKLQTHSGLSYISTIDRSQNKILIYVKIIFAQVCHTLEL